MNKNPKDYALSAIPTPQKKTLNIFEYYLLSDHHLQCQTWKH